MFTNKIAFPRHGRKGRAKRIKSTYPITTEYSLCSAMMNSVHQGKDIKFEYSCCIKQAEQYAVFAAADKVKGVNTRKRSKCDI